MKPATVTIQNYPCNVIEASNSNVVKQWYSISKNHIFCCCQFWFVMFNTIILQHWFKNTNEQANNVWHPNTNCTNCTNCNTILNHVTLVQIIVKYVICGTVSIANKTLSSFFSYPIKLNPIIALCFSSAQHTQHTVANLHFTACYVECLCDKSMWNNPFGILCCQFV